MKQKLNAHGTITKTTITKELSKWQKISTTEHILTVRQDKIQNLILMHVEHLMTKQRRKTLEKMDFFFRNFELENGISRINVNQRSSQS